MNFIWNNNSKQSKINETVVKIILYCENCNLVIVYIMTLEAYSEHYQIYKMECSGSPISNFGDNNLSQFWTGSNNSKNRSEH